MINAIFRLHRRSFQWTNRQAWTLGELVAWQMVMEKIDLYLPNIFEENDS